MLFFSYIHDHDQVLFSVPPAIAAQLADISGTGQGLLIIFDDFFHSIIAKFWFIMVSFYFCRINHRYSDYIRCHTTGKYDYITKDFMVSFAQ